MVPLGEHGAQPTILDRFGIALQEHDSRVRWHRLGCDLMAQCPVHGDRTASLHVTYKAEPGKPGLLLVHCFALCETGDVLAELGLSFRDLYDRPGAAAARQSKTYAQRVEERDRRWMCRIAERADQQARMEATPAYWLRRAVAFDAVGTPEVAEIATACRHRAEVASWTT